MLLTYIVIIEWANVIGYLDFYQLSCRISLSLKHNKIYQVKEKSAYFPL